jgi:hypothetical protein
LILRACKKFFVIKKVNLMTLLKNKNYSGSEWPLKIFLTHVSLTTKFYFVSSKRVSSLLEFR